MPKFPKEGSNTANMKGSQFYGRGNQSATPYASPAKSDFMAGFNLNPVTSDSDTIEQQTHKNTEIESKEGNIADAQNLKEQEQKDTFEKRRKAKENFENPDSENIDTTLVDQVYSGERIDADLEAKGHHTSGVAEDGGSLRGHKKSEHHDDASGRSSGREGSSGGQRLLGGDELN